MSIFREKIIINGYVMRCTKRYGVVLGDYYEKNLIYWLEKIIKALNFPIVYDIGANCGYYSLRFHSLAKHVYAFEPVIKTYKFLEKNINKIQNVTAFKLEISNNRNLGVINLYSSSGNNSIYKRNIPKTHPLRWKGTERIELYSLDDIYIEKKLMPPNVIKIEIEGAELFALQGARNTLNTFRPVLIIEYSSATSQDAGYKRELIINELIPFEYSIYGLSEIVEDLNLYTLEQFGDIEIANKVAIPKETTFNENFLCF